MKSLIIAIMMLVMCAVPFAALAGDGMVYQGEPDIQGVVEWNLAYRGDRLVGEIWVNGQVVIRIRQDMGGFGVEERTAIVASRLSNAVDEGLSPDDIVTGTRSSGPSIEIPLGHLVVVDEETAGLNRTTPDRLARIWANQIRIALGGDRLPEYITAVASWYGPGFHGLMTASGETFDSGELTAAHLSLPFGTILRVTNPVNHRSVLVRINDRGPHIPGRDLDLSQRAAEILGILGAGVATVWIEIILDH